MIGLTSYDNGAKASWRGWQWNEIVARLPEFSLFTRARVPKKGSAAERFVTQYKTFVYLRGPDGFDDTHAIAHGFSMGNAIAIDCDSNAASKARQDGVLAVNDDIASFLAAYRGLHIDVVVFDACCGFNSTAFNFIAAAMSCEAITAKTVLAVNLQRGRDAASTTIRNGKYMRAAAVHFGLSEKHRGFHFLMGHMALCREFICEWGKPDRIVEFDSQAILHAEPAFNEYRSSVVVMDSVVFRWCWWRGHRKDDDTIKRESPSVAKTLQRSKRRFAAAKAVYNRSN